MTSALLTKLELYYIALRNKIGQHVYGGWNKWFTEERPTLNRACAYQSDEFIAKNNSKLFVNKNEVLSAIGDDKITIINSLPAPLYTGDSDIVFGRTRIGYYKFL